MKKLPVVLTIAGSDSGGGAGIQGDIKTISALGGYACSAITALTAQNTLGVQSIMPVDADFVEAQIISILDDLSVGSIKTGMLFSSYIIERVSSVLKEKAKDIPLVVDPVMIAKGGCSLLKEEAKTSMIKSIIPLADIITPNIPEAEEISGLALGEKPQDEDMINVARSIQQLGAKAVLLKGGHSKSEMLTDILIDEDGDVHKFSSPHINSKNTHGTGCSYASAIATIMQTESRLDIAIKKAHDYIHKAILNAPDIGHGGHGPIRHYC